MVEPPEKNPERIEGINVESTPDHPAEEIPDKDPAITTPEGDCGKLSWRDHRRIVEDLSDSLAKNWRFKLQVCGVVIGLSLALLSTITLIIGGRVIDIGISQAEQRLRGRINELATSVEARLKTVDDSLNAVRRRVEAEIAKQFEEPQIQRTVQNVAETAAAKIIAEHVEPAERKVADRLRDFEKFLDDRKAQYESDQAAFRAEIDTLKKRNELTKLADRAVSDGSLSAYREILRIVSDTTDDDVKAAARAEEFRIVSAFGVLSPSRVRNTTINASVIDPSKTTDTELNSEQLCQVLAMAKGEPLARARAAFLLANKENTFTAAEALKNALETETHLEALRFEKAAFAKITGFKESGRLEATEELKWWSENADRLRKDLPK